MTEPEEKVEFIPPEVEYLSSKYIVNLPITNKNLGDPWKLRNYASKLIERKLGDEAQLTSMKLKKPGTAARAKAKLQGRVPQAKLYVTIKF